MARIFGRMTPPPIASLTCPPLRALSPSTICSKASWAAGRHFRIRARLQPAGGPGDKVFPPTYAGGQDGRKHDTRYALETRVIDGERKQAVLLDSVASQANRMELALLAARRSQGVELPLISVDFSEQFPEIGKSSALEAPHRVYDALLRDANLKDEAFRASEIGRALTDTSPKDARAMFRHCPTALLFGAWDSTGPKGGLGNKFQRALVSEVVGIGVAPGTKVWSRIDPLQTAAGVKLSVPKGNSDDWSVDDKGKSRPSEVNHSNIAPTRDEEAGGVTLEYALHIAVLSLPALRRLQFAEWSSRAGQRRARYLRSGSRRSHRNRRSVVGGRSQLATDAQTHPTRGGQPRAPQAHRKYELRKREGG